MPIRGVASLRDLYTVVVDGEEVDEYEHWIEAEFENPVQEVLEKIYHDKKLTTSDWKKIIMYFASQDVRTLTDYVESTELMKEKIPGILDKVLQKTINHFQKNTKQSGVTPRNDDLSKLFNNLINVGVIRDEEIGGGFIQAEVNIGRTLWIYRQRHILNGPAKILQNHKWSILEPAKGAEWITSDHPVARLNFFSNTNYNFKGGWNSSGTNLFMPLTPRHLLFTQIGSDLPDRIPISMEMTGFIQKMLAERALRWIFARRPLNEVISLRPRHIDSDAFAAEQQQYREWHENQSKFERKHSV